MRVTHLRLVADNTHPPIARRDVDWRALGRTVAAFAGGVYAVAMAPFRLIAFVAGLLVDIGRSIVRGFFKAMFACLALVFIVYPVCMVIFTIVHGALHHAGH